MEDKRKQPKMVFRRKDMYLNDLVQMAKKSGNSELLEEAIREIPYDKKTMRNGIGYHTYVYRVGERYANKVNRFEYE